MPTACERFLEAHAQDQRIPTQLYAQGEGLWQAAPAADHRWGAFLVAMGELAAESLGDDGAATVWFRRCLESEPAHHDTEACVVAGYGLAVIHERADEPARALAAYRDAASEGFRCACPVPATLRAATAAIRLGFARTERLDDTDRILAKQAWLGWTWLQCIDPAAVDASLADDLGRSLCAFLLPEDDPASLAGAWRAWPPHAIATSQGPWRDHDRDCLRSLFTCAAAAAQRFLGDEGPDPGRPYRLLAESAAFCQA